GRDGLARRTGRVRREPGPDGETAPVAPAACTTFEHRPAPAGRGRDRPDRVPLLPAAADLPPHARHALVAPPPGSWAPGPEPSARAAAAGVGEHRGARSRGAAACAREARRAAVHRQGHRRLAPQAPYAWGRWMTSRSSSGSWGGGRVR